MDYKILIADDEPEIRDLLRLYLENEQYEVMEAEDGQQALDLLRSRKPDLCVLDIMMPKMDGYMATREIRTLDNNKKANIPIIAMTANAFAEDVQLAKNTGMNEHIAKPLDLNKLNDVLKQWL